MDRILVTGGNGFIGAKLVQRLEEEGHIVESFDAVNGKDLRNFRDVENAVSCKDVVFHLAAVADLNWAKAHPVETLQINIEGTWNVAKACIKAGAILYYASTCCVYGNQEVHPSDELTLPNPSEIYACSKLAGENVIKGYSLTYDLPYNFMRFATIYGEGTRSALATHIFLGQALRGEPITVHGDGKQTRTLTHINDLIDAIMALYKSGRLNQSWNMTTEEEVSVLQTAHDIKYLTGSKSPIVFVPQRVGQTFKEALSAQKMKNLIGWEARIKWEDGIKRMYEWFLETDQKTNLYHIPT